MRAHNSAAVLNLAWEFEDGFARADISKRTGLSASTVSAIVQQFIESRLLVPGHLAPSRGGRPARVLRFNSQRNHIVGVELGATHVAVVLTDLRCTVHWHRYEPWDVSGDPEGTLALLMSMVEEARSRPEALGRTLAIGLAFPCPVDGLTPDLLSPRLFPKWSSVRPAAALFERFGLHVFVDNDANLGAFAEQAAGQGRGVSDFAYIKVATGVGAGLMVEGLLFRGVNGIAGEIGHTTVDPNGRPCRCGLRGCLEAEIGSGALADKAREGRTRYPSSVLAGMEELRDGDIVRAALGGDELARAVISEAGRHLGVAVANFLNLMNPARVIIGGRLAGAGELLLAPLRECARRRALWASVERVDISSTTLGPEQVALGAAAYVLRVALTDNRLFEDDVDPRSRGGYHW